VPDKDRPIARRQRLTAKRLESIRQETVAGRNVRLGTNTFGLQTGAGASSISKNTLPELAEVQRIMPVDEWDLELPAPWVVGALTKITDAVTGLVLYYRCTLAHTSNPIYTPGTPTAAGHWTLIHRPYDVYILDPQSGAQVHEYGPVFIDDGGLELPRYTRGVLGTGESGDKFMLPSDRHREWLWFYSPVYAGNGVGNMSLPGRPAAQTVVIYPPVAAGYIAGARALVYDTINSGGITAGTMTFAARYSTLADVAADGWPGAFVTGTDTLVLSLGVNAAKATDWGFIIPEGACIGAQFTYAALAHGNMNSIVYFGLCFETR